MSAVLETQRLILRAPRVEDVPRFVPLIGDFDVARNLASVPYPYADEDGHGFLARAAQKWTENEDFAFCVLRKQDEAFLGICGVHPKRHWEIGFWLGKAYWGRGYATEAAGRVIAFAFDELGAEHLAAGWYHDNPASGRVLEKLGFSQAGTEERPCLSRGRPILTYVVKLDRAAHKTRKNQL
jgi:ribosomal-protein-alanine N-acetyltransferase